MRRVLGLIVGLAALAVGAGAQAADWLRAETPHFVVYGAESERSVRTYATMLEDFDALLRVAHGRRLDEPVTRKLPVYLVNGVRQLRVVFPDMPDTIGGVYSANEDDIFALSIRMSAERTGDRTRGDDTVLHEYSHHFMLQYYPTAYPAWLIEGYAEYYATADLKEKITVGSVNGGRAYTLINEAWLPLESLLTKRSWDLPQGQRDVFYAQAWLLTHYLMSDPGRRRQLSEYLAAMRTNADPIASWTKIFGQTPAELTKTLRAYTRADLVGTLWQRSWAPPTITVTKIGPAASEVLLENQHIKLRSDKDQAQPALKKIRETATRHPTDPFVRMALGRAEVQFGDRKAGETILREVIAADPTNTEAMRVLAISLIEDSSDATRVAAYREAGKLLTAASKVDPDDYQTLYRYAQTRTVEPNYPTENTLNVLVHAANLAPQLDGLRINAAQAAMSRKETTLARRLLIPVASDPHGGDAADVAENLLKNLPADEMAAK